MRIGKGVDERLGRGRGKYSVIYRVFLSEGLIVEGLFLKRFSGNEASWDEYVLGSARRGILKTFHSLASFCQVRKRPTVEQNQ